LSLLKLATPISLNNLKLDLKIGRKVKKWLKIIVEAMVEEREEIAIKTKIIT
jgi:hypothetical protein